MAEIKEKTNTRAQRTHFSFGELRRPGRLGPCFPLPTSSSSGLSSVTSAAHLLLETHWVMQAEFRGLCWG